MFNVLSFPCYNAHIYSEYFNNSLVQQPTVLLMCSGAAGMVPSSTHMTSLLIPQSVVSSVAAPSTNGSTQTTSILVPVSVGPNKSLLNPTNSLLQPCKKSNDKAVGKQSTISIFLRSFKLF